MPFRNLGGAKLWDLKMLAGTKNSFFACVACFLAAASAFALLSDQSEMHTTLLTPPREVVYATRTPLAENGQSGENSVREQNETPTQGAKNVAPLDAE